MDGENGKIRLLDADAHRMDSANCHRRMLGKQHIWIVDSSLISKLFQTGDVRKVKIACVKDREIVQNLDFGYELPHDVFVQSVDGRWITCLEIGMGQWFRHTE